MFEFGVRMPRFTYQQPAQNARFCRRQPPGAIVVFVGTQAAKETFAQASISGLGDT